MILSKSHLIEQLTKTQKSKKNLDVNNFSLNSLGTYRRRMERRARKSGIFQGKIGVKAPPFINKYAADEKNPQGT